MRHITEYDNRAAAAACYKAHRRLWSRQAAIVLTHYQHAVHPVRRLAAALSLCVFGIPPDGKPDHSRRTLH